MHFKCDPNIIHLKVISTIELNAASVPRTLVPYWVIAVLLDNTPTKQAEFNCTHFVFCSVLSINTQDRGTDKRGRRIKSKLSTYIYLHTAARIAVSVRTRYEENGNATQYLGRNRNASDLHWAIIRFERRPEHRLL
jgi:hypothetical protein